MPLAILHNQQMPIEQRRHVLGELAERTLDFSRMAGKLIGQDSPMSSGKAQREDPIRSRRFESLLLSCHERLSFTGPIGIQPDGVGLFDKVGEL